MARRTCVGQIILPLTLVVGCALAPTLREVEGDVREERYDEALVKLEELREGRPTDPAVRSALSYLYFLLALRTLRGEAEDDYFRYLQLSADEAIEVMELEPRLPGPHSHMGIVAGFQGELDRALHHFHNARRLGPNDWLHYLNISEIHLLKGEISVGRHWLETCRRRGAPPGAVEYASLLAAWRTGDLNEAQDLFGLLYELDSEFTKSRWENSVAEPGNVENLEDLAGRCCASVVCGPYMSWLCREMRRDVRWLEQGDEQRREMLRRERERQQRIREIYERNKDVEIAIEPPGEQE
jgi:tetratricopeptide (TPR) repeat protein